MKEGTEQRIPIEDELDIVAARQAGRQLAAALGFGATDQTLIATAISEVARNIVIYAQQGEVVLREVGAAGRVGLEIIARDEGPGIPDIELAMRDGFSTTRSLGLGLPGARRLMDELELASQVGRGTTVTMRKWRR